MFIARLRGWPHRSFINPCLILFRSEQLKKLYLIFSSADESGMKKLGPAVAPDQSIETPSTV